MAEFLLGKGWTLRPKRKRKLCLNLDTEIKNGLEQEIGKKEKNLSQNDQIPKKKRSVGETDITPLFSTAIGIGNKSLAKGLKLLPHSFLPRRQEMQMARGYS